MYQKSCGRRWKEGAKVVVWDLLDCGETAKEIESGRGEVLVLKTDVTSEESTVEMAKKIFECCGECGYSSKGAWSEKGPSCYWPRASSSW